MSELKDKLGAETDPSPALTVVSFPVPLTSSVSEGEGVPTPSRPLV